MNGVVEKLKTIFANWHQSVAEWHFFSMAQANVGADNWTKPAILVESPTLGEFFLYSRRIKDRPRLRIWALCRQADGDANRYDTEAQVEEMKILLCKYLVCINESGLFERIEQNVGISYIYAVNYLDSGLCGVGVDLYLKERVASVNLCDFDPTTDPDEDEEQEPGNDENP